MKITVVRLRKNYPAFAICRGNRYPVDRAWAVREDGARNGFHVVTCKTGHTLIDPDCQMRSCWHLGIAPGALARLHWYLFHTHAKEVTQ